MERIAALRAGRIEMGEIGVHSCDGLMDERNPEERRRGGVIALVSLIPTLSK